MSRPPSRETKLSRHMGMGTGREYRPYITTSEFNSQGTTAVIPDWKTGRGVHCMSQGEAYWFYVLRWDDENIDIREQFPLDRIATEQITEIFKFKHPGNKPDYVMTTDFVVTKADGSTVAYSVKHDRNLSKRTLQLLCIEKAYWEGKGATFQMLFKEDLNLLLVENIRNVVRFYNIDNVFDEYSLIKHKIATKQVPWDMEHDRITNSELRIRRIDVE